MEMPEKIWAEPISGQQPTHRASMWGLWRLCAPRHDPSTEYTRTDLVDTPLKEKDARIERLEGALRQSQSALIGISQTLGLAEAGMDSLPYVLKQPKIAVDLAIMNNANALKENP